ncbi:hypothetical protein C7N43_00415 [Sphingobacteriales bacterium UPWRP_1]|nr:hypothetical protein BVG80_15345 [Sphingobacteriales bacterium TSM_CSM]PSJ79122.1 hypothetical protein C7N43_00415 [Sphingobacteriales bacterium UPWRP_1]
MPQNCSQLQLPQQTAKLTFMKYTLVCCVVLLFVITALCGCQKSAGEPFFENLLGKWQIDGRQVVETWQRGKHPDTIYTAQVVENINGKFLLREQIFVTRQNKQITYNVYIKSLRGGGTGKGVPFRLTSVTDNKAVFENPQHEFPQKITYQLKDNNTTLVTEVSGSMDGQPQSFSFVHHPKK